MGFPCGCRKPRTTDKDLPLHLVTMLGSVTLFSVVLVIKVSRLPDTSSVSSA